MPWDFGYSQAKVLKNGLKSRVLRLGGVHHGGWWAPIFYVFDAAEKVAIGRCFILSRKSREFP